MTFEPSSTVINKHISPIGFTRVDSVVLHMLLNRLGFGDAKEENVTVDNFLVHKNSLTKLNKGKNTLLDLSQ